MTKYATSNVSVLHSELVSKSKRQRTLFEHANDMEFVIIRIFPSGRVAEVWIVHELSPTLRPTNWLHLRVSVDKGRVCIKLKS